jgi:hypothetical protein
LVTDLSSNLILLVLAFNANITPVSAFMQGYPYWQDPLSFNLNDIVGPTLVPFCLTFLLPVFMHTIIMEKENRIREMMKMMGMKMSTYWALNYLFDFLVYCLVLAIFCIAELLLQVRLFTQTR